MNFLRKARRIGTDREVRAIVVLDLETVTDKELTNMHALGVRGVRFNMAASGKAVQASDLSERILTVAKRLEGLKMLKNWFLQLFIPGNLWEGNEIHLSCPHFTQQEARMEPVHGILYS